MIELFHCVKLSTSLSRVACGKRYAAARRPYRANSNAIVVDQPACRHCEMGAQHDAGNAPTRWPNGDPVRLVSADTLVPRLRAPAAAPERAPEPEAPPAPVEPPKPASPRVPRWRRPTTAANRKKAAPSWTTYLTHTVDGATITDTFGGWAARLGLTENAVRMRARKYPGRLEKVLAPPAGNALSRRGARA